MAELAELFLRFLLIGALAFGGGASALPLVERLSVAETKWLTPQDFAVGVGFAYATPGPILILAPFIGYRVAGLLGALTATIAVFLIPVLLAGAAAGVTERLRTALEARARTTSRPYEDVRDAAMNGIPAGRFGDPREFGAVCAFLCSVHAAYIAGQNVLVDGGAYPGTF